MWVSAARVCAGKPVWGAAAFCDFVDFGYVNFSRPAHCEAYAPEPTERATREIERKKMNSTGRAGCGVSLVAFIQISISKDLCTGVITSPMER